MLPGVKVLPPKTIAYLKKKKNSRNGKLTPELLVGVDRGIPKQHRILLLPWVVRPELEGSTAEDTTHFGHRT